MRYAALVGAVLAVTLMGCATAEKGRKFDTAAAQQIEVGKTTEAQVLTDLGEPLYKKVNSDGTKSYGYAYGKATAYAFSRRNKRILGQGDKFIVTFDKNGIVSSTEQDTMPLKVGPGTGD